LAWLTAVSGERRARHNVSRQELRGVGEALVRGARARLAPGALDGPHLIGRRHEHQLVDVRSRAAFEMNVRANARVVGSAEDLLEGGHGATNRRGLHNLRHDYGDPDQDGAQRSQRNLKPDAG
jgi:hypothetical protein